MCYLTTQGKASTRFRWVVLLFHMKLVGSAVIWRLNWAGFSRNAHFHPWMLVWAFCIGLRSPLVAFPHGQVGRLTWCLLLRGTVSQKKEVEAVSLYVLVSKFSGLSLHFVGQSSHSTNTDSRGGELLNGEVGMCGPRGKELMMAILGNIHHSLTALVYFCHHGVCTCAGGWSGALCLLHFHLVVMSWREPRPEPRGVIEFWERSNWNSKWKVPEWIQQEYAFFSIDFFFLSIAQDGRKFAVKILSWDFLLSTRRTFAWKLTSFPTYLGLLDPSIGIRWLNRD